MMNRALDLTLSVTTAQLSKNLCFFCLPNRVRVRVPLFCLVAGLTINDVLLWWETCRQFSGINFIVRLKKLGNYLNIHIFILECIFVFSSSWSFFNNKITKNGNILYAELESFIVLHMVWGWVIWGLGPKQLSLFFSAFLLAGFHGVGEDGNPNLRVLSHFSCYNLEINTKSLKKNT